MTPIPPKDALTLICAAMTEEELRLHIESGRLRPCENREDGCFLDEADIARLRLIDDIFHRIAPDNETAELILALTDNLHRARARLHRLAAAVERQPRRVQSEIFSLIYGERE